MSIIVVTGPPGAGKTTVAAGMARSVSQGVHLVADQCFHWIVAGYIAPWLPESHRQNATVIEVVGSAAARYAAGGYDVVVDGIVGPWLLPHFLHAVGTVAGGLRYVILRPSRDIARGRAVGRTGEGDLVDSGPVDAMYDVFEGLGLFEAHVVDSSDRHPEDTIAGIRRGVDDGRFIVDDRHHGDMARIARKYGVDLAH